MGLIRKVTSVTTLGAVDFRSAKDKTAAYARGTRKHARRAAKAAERGAAAQEKVARRSGQQLIAQTVTAASTVQQQRMAIPAQPPPQWFVDQYDPRFVRWWDGARYTEHVRPR